MSLMALSRGATDGGLGNTRVVPKNIEARLLGEEGGSAVRNCGEVAEVERQTLDLPRACKGNGLYGLDLGSNFGRGAAGDVDCAAFRVQKFNELEPDACVATSHDKYFAYERRQVLFSQCWAWWKELRPIPSHDGWMIGDG